MEPAGLASFDIQEGNNPPKKIRGGGLNYGWIRLCKTYDSQFGSLLFPYTSVVSNKLFLLVGGSFQFDTPHFCLGQVENYPDEKNLEQKSN